MINCHNNNKWIEISDWRDTTNNILVKFLCDGKSNFILFNVLSISV